MDGPEEAPSGLQKTVLAAVLHYAKGRQRWPTFVELQDELGEYPIHDIVAAVSQLERHGWLIRFDQCYHARYASLGLTFLETERGKILAEIFSGEERHDHHT